MSRSEQSILVVGATGHQGGAVAKHLLADGWHVRALVRDAAKPAAVALASVGAELVLGDLDDRASLDAATAGAYGVYSVEVAVGGPESEIRQAENVASAAKAAGMRHFVYSSVRGADRESPMPWVASKRQVEAYLRALDMPLTIWRPVTFMENLLRQRESMLAGKLTGFEPDDFVHQWIAADDIGRFVALSFREPEAWLGKATEIAGDELTWPQAADVFSAVMGVPVVYEEQPAPAGMPAPTPGAPEPTRADIAKLREAIPDLQTLAHWAAEQHVAGAL